MTSYADLRSPVRSLTRSLRCLVLGDTRSAKWPLGAAYADLRRLNGGDGAIDGDLPGTPALMLADALEALTEDHPDIARACSLVNTAMLRLGG